MTHWRPLRRWLAVGSLVAVIVYLDFADFGQALLVRFRRLIDFDGWISWSVNISVRSVFRLAVGALAVLGTIELVEGDLLERTVRVPSFARPMRETIHRDPILAAGAVVMTILCWYLAIFPPQASMLLLAVWRAVWVAAAGLLLCASLFEDGGWKYVPLSAVCLCLSGSSSCKLLLAVDGLAMAAHSFRYFRHLYFLYAAKKDFHERVTKVLKSDGFHPVFVEESFHSLVRRFSRSSSIRKMSSFVVKRMLSNASQAQLLNEKFDMLGSGMDKLRSRQRSTPHEHMINVRRSELISSSFRALEEAPLSSLLAETVRVRFEGEAGLDDGGVIRDWFDSLGTRLTEEAAEGRRSLLSLQECDGTLVLRGGTGRWEDFYALGRLLALAVCRGARIPVHFSRATWKMLMREPIEANDVRAIDPVFFKNRIRAVLEPDGVEAMEDILGEPLTFMSATTPTCLEPVPLLPGGEDTLVTEANKLEYVQKLCEYYLCGHVQREWQLLIQGFEDLLPRDLLRESEISHTDLELMVCGVPTIDIEDWRNNSYVDGPLKATVDGNKLISWFWECVEQFGNERRARLLQFATGSSRLPPEGFAGLRPEFCIYVSPGMPEQLPTASTCNNQLNLIDYPSRRALIDKVTTACHEASEGFGFL